LADFTNYASGSPVIGKVIEKLKFLASRLKMHCAWRYSSILTIALIFSTSGTRAKTTLLGRAEFPA
ncbi:MAG: hypothetical protein ACREXR_14110, partial [Gammaproteobacteria bacterium]